MVCGGAGGRGGGRGGDGRGSERSAAWTVEASGGWVRAGMWKVRYDGVRSDWVRLGEVLGRGWELAWDPASDAGLRSGVGC